MYPHIDRLTAREILDSRGNPTIEVSCHLTDGNVTTAGVPSGASTGSHEAHELRDEDPKRYAGKGVLRAVAHVEGEISAAVHGMLPTSQREIDQVLIKLDGTEHKSRLGANAILGVSIAVTKAGALVKKVPIYRHVAFLARNDVKLEIPVPIFNILNGGAHAGMNLDFQEFIAIAEPSHIPLYPDQLELGVGVFHALGDDLKERNLPVSVGDEGGYAPRMRTNRAAMRALETASEDLGYTFGKHVKLGMDLAANTYLHENKYVVKDSKEPLSSKAYIEFLGSLIEEFAPYSFEDPLDEDDWEGWAAFTKQYGDRLVIIGDDHLVTNLERLKKAVADKTCNAILIKPNQIGTITETLGVMQYAKKHNFKTIVSHRSGETNDAFIADFAVGSGADHVKFGAPDRGERVAKYNRLSAIYEQIR